MKERLEKLSAGESLSEEETFETLNSFFSEDTDTVSDEEIAEYLTLTANRPVTVDELVGAVRSLRSHMVKVDGLPGVEFVDTCGTGGSGLDTFNTSTASAFVVAGAGQAVAKHGNRGATSRSGSADVLSALGLNLELGPEQIKRCVEETNFGFMFAPMHHPATKRVVPIRKQLGIRTIFNFLGPLSNPMSASYQVMGVSSLEMLPIIAEALNRLGTKKALIVRGNDGLDEITTSDSTVVYEIKDGEVLNYKINPEDFGLNKVSFSEISGAEPSEAAQMIRLMLQGEKSPRRDLVALNAGAALYISGKASSIKEGIALAENSIDSNNAQAVLDKVIEISND